MTVERGVIVGCGVIVERGGWYTKFSKWKMGFETPCKNVNFL